MVHESGHLIVDRYKPSIDYLSLTGRKPASEPITESFGLSLLMPASSVCQTTSMVRVVRHPSLVTVQARRGRDDRRERTERAAAGILVQFITIDLVGPTAVTARGAGNCRIERVAKFMTNLACCFRRCAARESRG
jgi:hypothetical protein